MSFLQLDREHVYVLDAGAVIYQVRAKEKKSFVLPFLSLPLLFFLFLSRSVSRCLRISLFSLFTFPLALSFLSSSLFSLAHTAEK